MTDDPARPEPAAPGDSGVDASKGVADPASPRASFRPGGFDPNTGSLKESFEEAFGEGDDDLDNATETATDADRPSSDGNVTDAPERELHPATEHMLTNMPSLISRGIIYAVILFIAVAGIWAYLSKTDVVVRGNAVVVAEARDGDPEGQVVQVHSQASVGAVIANLHVKAGDRVKAGDLLMTLAVQDLERLQGDVDAANLDLQLKQAELKRHDEVRVVELDAQLRKLEDRREALRRTKVHNTESLRELVTERESRLKSITDDVTSARRRQDMLTASAKIDVRQLQAKAAQLEAQRSAQVDAAKRFEAQAGSAKREYEQLRSAAQQDMVEESRVTSAHLQWLQMENDLASSREQAKLLQLQIDQIKVDIEKAESQTVMAIAELDGQIQSRINERATIEAGHRVKVKEYDRLDSQTDAQLAELDMQEAQLRASLGRERVALEQGVEKATLTLIQARERVQLDESVRSILSPIDGELTMIGASRVGEFVRPGQQLATVAGPHARMVAQITIENKDIGGLRHDQAVKLKFDAWNFQNWGVVTGSVITISPDALENEKTGGYTYRILASFDPSRTSRKGKQVDIRYGMTATAEIIQRQRRVIDILLEPFQKLGENFNP